ncbi:MAG: hypothetical protein WBA54_11570 [Acidaminobacteraceae bacterium]
MVLPLMVILVSICSLYLLSEYLREKGERSNISVTDMEDKELLSKILELTKSTNDQVRNIKYIILLLLLVNIINLLEIKLF